MSCHLPKLILMAGELGAIIYPGISRLPSGRFAASSLRGVGLGWAENSPTELLRRGNQLVMESCQRETPVGINFSRSDVSFYWRTGRPGIR